jgi:hypothetical protein
MGGHDDRHWDELERQKAERGAEGVTAGEERLLHPGNQGQDEERVRSRLEAWQEEEGPAGKAARELGRMEGPKPTSPPPVEAASPSHGGRAGGGEPKKHPRKPEETTPEPGRGRRKG